MAEKNMNAKISVEFEETANRQQLSSGDNLPTLFGKIKKFFTDLKAVAFSGSYIDLSDRPTTATTETDGLMSASDKGKLDAFEISTTGGKLHDKDIATTDLIPSSLPANGGVAENISEWGTRVYSDLNNADFGFSASCSAVGHLNSPNSFWSTVLTTGSNDTDGFKTQFAFPWSADTSNQKMKYRVMNDNVWHDWSEMYTSSNKPYVTGSATIPADSDTCTTYHGFMPSAAIWWYDDICGAAVSFNENQITVGSTSSTYRTINYLIFK